VYLVIFFQGFSNPNTLKPFLYTGANFTVTTLSSAKNQDEESRKSLNKIPQNVSCTGISQILLKSFEIEDK